LKFKRKNLTKHCLSGLKYKRFSVKNLKQAYPDFRVFDSFEDPKEGGEMHG